MSALDERPLAGRLCVVTGAGRGIGRAIVAALVAAGARRFGLCARTGAELEAAAAALTAAGAETVWAAADVSDEAAVEAFAGAVGARLGVPDLLVNNAGTVVRAPLERTSRAGWDDVLGSNLLGTFLVTRAFLAGMKARGSGRIVNVASIAGRQGTAGLTAYCAAKHGVVGLTRALAEELRPAGLQVNAVCPGSVDTPMLQAGMPGAEPAMTPDDVARVVRFLAAEAPAALTGACLDVFG